MLHVDMCILTFLYNYVSCTCSHAINFLLLTHVLAGWLIGAVDLKMNGLLPFIFMMSSFGSVWMSPKLFIPLFAPSYVRICST